MTSVQAGAIIGLLAGILGFLIIIAGQLAVIAHIIARKD